jgi:hypothetical protein
MATLFNYGTTDAIPFKVTKNGEGVSGLTFSAGDIYHITPAGTATDVTGDITELNATNGKGIYVYTPSAASYTEHEWFIINVDEASGTNFDENMIVCMTGGNASARYSG